MAGIVTQIVGSVSTPALEIAPGTSSTDIAGPVIQGAVNESPPTYVTGEVRPLSLNTEGAMRVLAIPPQRDLEFVLPFNFGNPDECIWSLSNNPWGT